MTPTDPILYQKQCLIKERLHTNTAKQNQSGSYGVVFYEKIEGDPRLGKAHTPMGENEMTVELKSNRLDWDGILENYGPDAKIAITKLLHEAEINEGDPASVIIAAMFISQIDTNRAYLSVKTTLDEGKSEIAQELGKSIEQLRGIVSFAQEKLMIHSEEKLEKNHHDMMKAIKAGVAKTLGQESSKRYKRSVVLTSATTICAALVSLVGIFIGGGGVYAVMRSSQPEVVSVDQLNAVPNGSTWLKVAESNQEQLDVCMDKASELNHRCVIEVP